MKPSRLPATHAVVRSVLCAACLANAGCLAVVAGTAAGTGVAYAKGDEVAVVKGQPERVVDAIVAVLDDMSVTVINRASSSLDGGVTARTATDEKIKFVVKRETDNTSRVSVRVGVFGDDITSSDILQKLREELE